MQENDQPLVGEVVTQNSPPPGYGPQTSVQAYKRHHNFGRALVAVNIVVYILMVLKGVSPFSPSLNDLVHWGAMFGPEFVAGQRWRLVTSAFVHIGIIHLGFNMWCLWYLAELSENLFGGWTTVAIYLLTAMTSSLLSVIWRPVAVSAGASGAIFGLAGAIIVGLRVGEHHVPIEVRRAISNSALRFALLNLVFGLLPGIDNAGHLGGMIGGLVLGAGYGATDSMITQSDQPLRRALVSLGLLIVLAAILFWFFPPGHPHGVSAPLAQNI